VILHGLPQAGRYFLSMAYTTFSDAKTGYLTNAGYRTANSSAMALLFIEACDALLLLRPASTGRGEQSISFETLKDAKRSAEEWLAANPPSINGTGRQSQRYADMSNFRDEW
jgi:hypothetical protein